MENQKSKLVVGSRYQTSESKPILRFDHYSSNGQLAYFTPVSNCEYWGLSGGYIPFPAKYAEVFEKVEYVVNKFKNDTDIAFKPISNEKFRIYNFSNGGVLRIENPMALHVSESGGHRVIAEGFGYYIQPFEGWYIVWAIKDGEPVFVL